MSDLVPLIVQRVFNRIGRPLGINPFPRAFEYNLSSAESADAFDTIFKENRWKTGDSHSGTGSELTTTMHYRKELMSLVNKRKFNSMFDAPCGDLNWMPSMLKHVAMQYEGGDISTALVAQLKVTHPELAIRQFDIRSDNFPKVDVWHCRDCLFHLPLADIRRVLENFVASEVHYALLTTHHASFLHKNLDLKGIGFRFLDLEREPMMLPRPIAYLRDYKVGGDFPRYVGLWSRESIAKALQRHQW